MPDNQHRQLYSKTCYSRQANLHYAERGRACARRKTEEVLCAVELIKPRDTYFTHMMHHIGLHAKIEKCLPAGVHLAYDCLQIEI